MTNSINPFRPTRWEHHSDGLPLIWFTETAELLAGDKSSYIHGSRGSGKTSLLRSICWEDLLNNPSLQLQRSLTDSRHIGIYIRLPDHVSGSLGFTQWETLFPKSPRPELEFFRFFSLAVELICVEKALTACHTLRVAGKLNIEALQESRVVREVLDEYPKLTAFSDTAPTSFLALARLCRNATRLINEASGRGTIGQLIETLPPREPNDILSYVVERLSGVCRLQDATQTISPGFKFCLDDCEVLNKLQRTSVNTLVRKSRFPISWVLCSVGDAVQSGDTFLHQQPLTDADRQVISLDKREQHKFQEICEAVASLRVYFSLPSDKRPPVSSSEIGHFFSLTDRLGTQDVNDLFANMISRSTNRPLCELLQKAAAALREKLPQVDKRYKSRFADEAARLPYSEAYILLHWSGTEDAFRTDASEADIPKMLSLAERLKSASSQAWIRRKMVASMLQFSARLGNKRIPLAGTNMLVSLADGSIRDFLEIMGEVYDEHTGLREETSGSVAPHERFALSRTKISFKVQANGINKASQSFHRGIGAQADADPESLIRLIDSLGKYTSLLQSNPDDPSTLGRAERGIFVLDFSKSLLTADEAEFSNVANLFRRAELAGYLRVVVPRDATHRAATSNEQIFVAYRLHKRFAPYYRFSYRGAYEPVRLRLESLGMICRQSNPISADSWLQTIGQSSGPAGLEQLALPWQRSSDDD